MMLAAPWVIGAKPEHGTAREKAMWGIYGLSYVAILMGLFLAAAFGAALIIRRQKKEFLEESTRNLTELVKGTLEDHARKNS